MTPQTEAPYRIKARSVSFYRPTLRPSEMSSLKGTKQDLQLLIEKTTAYLRSPQADHYEKIRLEEFLEGLHGQLDDINRRLAEGQV